MLIMRSYKGNYGRGWIEFMFAGSINRKTTARFI